MNIARDYPGLDREPALQLRLRSEEETRLLGRLIARQVVAGDFLGLIGDLGAGKTTVMKGFMAQITEAPDEISSPTYSLIQHYESSPPVAHMDFYRLASWDELESIGYWDIYEAGNEVICVEWLDRIKGAWPGAGMVLKLERIEGKRRACLWWSRDLQARFLNLAQDIRASRLEEEGRSR